MPEYWIVDGEHRTIRVVRPRYEDAIVADELRWHPAGASEPFVLDVAGVFREALG